MSKSSTPAVLQALEAILEKPATVVQLPAREYPEVRLVLDKEVTPEQFRGLSQLCDYLHNYPTVKRSGAGVSVIFYC